MRKALYVMGELNDADIEWMVRNGERRAIARGAALIEQHEPVTAIYITLRGEYVVRDDAHDRRELARIGSGEVVGEMSFIQAQPPAVSVTALEDGVVLAVPRRALWEKLLDDEGFSSRFYRSLAMFLADRLRGTVKAIGYGAAAPDAAEAPVNEEELDPAFRAFVRRANHRFDALVKQLDGEGHPTK